MYNYYFLRENIPMYPKCKNNEKVKLEGPQNDFFLVMKCSDKNRPFNDENCIQTRRVIS